MKILIVDDCKDKTKNITDCLCQNEYIKSSDISVVDCTINAKPLLYENNYDLLIIDINLPTYPDEDPDPNEGANFLHHISFDSNINVPMHILGITEYSECFDMASSRFNEKMWSLIEYDSFSETWKRKLTEKIRHIFRSRINDRYIEKFDICLITVVDVETKAVRNLPYNWSRMSIDNDPIIYYRGEITCDKSERKISIVTASTDRMGMIATSTLATKMITNFNPNYLCMVGICAGVKSKVNIGDIIIGDPLWSYESGKYSVSDTGSYLFSPSPHQINLNADLRADIHDLVISDEYVKTIYDSYDEYKYDSIPMVHLGPIGSGSAVIANINVVENVKQQHRELLGIEMEGYGLYYASSMTSKRPPKCLLIKSVCDFADEKKDHNYQKYCSYMSCGFFDHFVKQQFSS
ncbi:TPA: hypothetical protein ACX6O4_001364 [Photobacterium damselae]